MDEALLSINLVGRGQLVKMLIAPEPYGIFGSILACLSFFNIVKKFKR